MSATPTIRNIENRLWRAMQDARRPLDTAHRRERQRLRAEHVEALNESKAIYNAAYEAHCARKADLEARFAEALRQEDERLYAAVHALPEWQEWLATYRQNHPDRVDDAHLRLVEAITE